MANHKYHYHGVPLDAADDTADADLQDTINNIPTDSDSEGSIVFCLVSGSFSRSSTPNVT